MIILEPNQFGEGWAQIAFTHEDPKPLLRTLDEWYHESKGWQTSSFFTSDKEPFRGNRPYRRPVSARAKLAAVFPGWFVKVWRRKVAPLFRSTQ